MTTVIHLRSGGQVMIQMRITGARDMALLVQGSSGFRLGQAESAVDNDPVRVFKPLCERLSVDQW